MRWTFRRVAHRLVGHVLAGAARNLAAWLTALSYWLHEATESWTPHYPPVTGSKET